MLAYLDAGTGSQVIGVVAAGAAGVGVAASMAWNNISPRRRKAAKKAAQEAGAETEDNDQVDETLADADDAV